AGGGRARGLRRGCLADGGSMSAEPRDRRGHRAGDVDERGDEGVRQRRRRGARGERGGAGGPPGGLVVVLGCGGGGKTTLINIIGGIESLPPVRSGSPGRRSPGTARRSFRTSAAGTSGSCSSSST